MKRPKLKPTSIALDPKLVSELRKIQELNSLPGLRRVSISDLARIAFRHWIDAGTPMPRVTGSIQQEALNAAQQA